MENSSLLEFKQLNPDYYMCKRCRTHIALAEDFIFYHIPEPDVAGGLFNKVVNVNVEDELRRRKRIAWHKFVYCKRCDSALGLKYVEVDKNQTLIKNGMVQLNMKKLLMRQGNRYLDGETMVPLHRPDHYKCKCCRNYIALATDIRRCIFESAGQHHISRIIFNKADNVRIIDDPTQLQKVGPHTFAGVHCVNCNQFLGWKIIATDDQSFTIVVQSELVELYAKALLWSHGNNIVPAETIIPPHQ